MGWRWTLALWLATLMGWWAGPAAAQSACTAIWGIRSPTTTSGGLSYLNTQTGQWSPILLNLPGNPNALAGSPTSGLLYFLDRNTQLLYSINLNAYPLAYTQIGAGPIPAPPAPALAGNMVAGTTDGAGNYFVYATQGAYDNYVAVAQISTATAATVTSWTQVLTTGGALPGILGYGDMFVDRFGSTWIATNTNPPTLHQIDLNPGPTFARTNVPPLTITGANRHEAFSVAADPITGNVYMGGATDINLAPGGPYNSVTFRVTLPSGVATPVPQADSGYFLSDMGNCALSPTAPSVTKTFAPSSRTFAPGTSTLTIHLANPNLAPVYLTADFQDLLPAGLSIDPTPLLSGSCVIAGNTVTAPAGGNAVTVSAGSRIPAGGCTVSVRVLTNLAGSYVNTLAANSLRTTAGSNALAAQATFQVGSTDFSMAKTQRVGLAGALSSAPLNVPSGATLQYVLTVVNGAGSASAGSVTFSDALPSAITPVLTVSAVTTGSGNCTTATSVVAGRTIVNGTFTAVLRGDTCTVTITARTAVTNIALAATNAAGLTALPAAVDTYDSNPANNTATVITNIIPFALLSATKSNGVNSLAAGGTTQYTIAVVNQGPAAADGTRVADPQAIGLACSSVTCAGAGGAVCPPAPLSLAQFQSPAGLPISSFPAASTATFSLTCRVTATGL